MGQYEPHGLGFRVYFVKGFAEIFRGNSCYLLRAIIPIKLSEALKTKKFCMGPLSPSHFLVMCCFRIWGLGLS